MSVLRQLALVLAWLLLFLGTCAAINATAGKTEVGTPLSGGALPVDLVGSSTAASPEAAVESSSSKVSSTSATLTIAKPGVPVGIDIPFRSSNYPAGLHAGVTANRLKPDGSLFVPDDPKTVSWASQDAAPGSARGTVILTSHVNYVINGHTVIGAFSDLAEYARTAVGKQLTLRLADGRRLRYQLVAAREYNKHQLASNPSLRTELFNQTASYGPPGKPKTSRLLLVSCGGAFDNSTGEYEDNVFLYALPVAGLSPPATGATISPRLKAGERYPAVRNLRALTRAS